MADTRLAWIVLVVGCATLDASEQQRLAALPRVPETPQVPAFPPALQGLRFHVRGLVADSGKTRPAIDQAAQSCMSNFEQWMGHAGWIPVPDSEAPTDLVIDEYCGVNLSITSRGNLIELSHPVWQDISIIVRHDGVPMVTVPRGPRDYVCESSGTREEMVRDCLARSEAWAQGRIIQELLLSEPLAALARQRAGTP
jgi:hypothetical protein